MNFSSKKTSNQQAKENCEKSSNQTTLQEKEPLSTEKPSNEEILSDFCDTICDTYHENKIVTSPDGKRYLKRIQGPRTFFRLISSQRLYEVSDNPATTDLMEMFVMGNYDIGLSKNLAQTILNYLRARAKTYGHGVILFRRSYGYGKCYLYNPADSSGNIYKVTRDSVSLVTPKSFYPVTDPEMEISDVDLSGQPGDFISLLESLFRLEDDSLFLLATYLCCLFAKSPSSPIILLSSPPGTGKSTVAEAINMIYDPREHSALSAAPRTTHELEVNLATHDTYIIDNLSRIDSDTNDTLCLSVSSGFAKKRKLFSDCELVILPLACSVIITSVTVPSQRSDLISREVLLTLPPFEGHSRESHQTYFSRVQKAAPKIRGAILNILSLILGTNDSDFPLPDDVRLTEFCLMGMKLFSVLGKNPDEFVEIFRRNQDYLLTEVGSGNFVFTAISSLVKQAGGTLKIPAEELLGKITEMAKRKNIKDGIPGSGNALSRLLTNSDTILSSFGITFKPLHGTIRTLSFKMESTNTLSAEDLAHVKRPSFRTDTDNDVVAELLSGDNEVVNLEDM